MDRDWRQGARRPRDKASFHRDVDPYQGTSRDFDIAHAQRYGQEEGMGPDGRHRHGPKPSFPQGSERQNLWESYDQSTHGRDVTRDAYEKELISAYGEYKNMDRDEKDYYSRNTGVLSRDQQKQLDKRAKYLRPDQHERLDPRAAALRDESYNNATTRESFLQSHPHGYHSMEDQLKHHGYASKAYGEYEYASTQQKHHEKHRSYSNVDKRKDPYGRPVSRR